MTTEKIAGFHGPHSFLSNFDPSPITDADGITYPTVEHWFQAHKTTDLDARRRIAAKPKPGQAKYAGKRVTLREGWNEGLRLEVMAEALAAKFAPGTEHAAKLEATGDARLLEVNSWNDRYWGCDRNERGENNLGRLLEERREANRRQA